MPVDESATITVSSSSDHITYYPSQTTFISDQITWIQPDTITLPATMPSWGNIRITVNPEVSPGDVWIESDGYYFKAVKNIKVEEAKENLRTYLSPLQRQRLAGQARAKGQNCEFLFVEEMGV